MSSPWFGSRINTGADRKKLAKRPSSEVVSILVLLLLFGWFPFPA